MALPDIGQLLDSKALFGIAGTVLGALGIRVFSLMRSRIKTLEYTVTHNQVAVSEKGPLGDIEVRLYGAPAKRVWLSRLDLTNNTGTDFGKLEFRVFTSKDCDLWGGRAELSGTSKRLEHTPAFNNLLVAQEDGGYTAAQQEIFLHSREYVVPVLNRGQAASFFYLTTVSDDVVGPSIWAELLHPGVKLEYRNLVPVVHGVPLKIAKSLGLFAAVVVFGLASYFLAEPWTAALLCLFAGLMVQPLGALVYRGFRFIGKLASH
ncbi:hypothetical protein [Variovorax paradoxus]|uniref:hypothetical protein n=1 Tax=Variovorax paradoxus TaxID=34073 RepID=UPI0029C8DC3F|nr:hypothetical protein [Variovorax paradoxus]WPH18240.1 hypothetical protein RZE78_14480 [Variovorax paradoxus]